MSGSITPFPAWRQPHLYAVAEAQHAHLQLSGQLVAVAGCAVGTAKQGDRLLAQLLRSQKLRSKGVKHET